MTAAPRTRRLARAVLVAVLLVAVLAGLSLWALLRVGSWLVVEDPLARAAAIVVMGGHVPFRAMEAAALYNASWAPEVWLTRAASGPEESGTVERIVGTATRAITALRENELFVRIVELDPQLLLPYLLSRRGRSQQAILDLVADQLRSGQATGEVRETDPYVLARALLLATHGFVLSAHTMVVDLVSEEALEAELAEILTRAVRP